MINPDDLDKSFWEVGGATETEREEGCRESVSFELDQDHRRF